MRSPCKVDKLTVALEQRSVPSCLTYVDFAVEVPGHFDYMQSRRHEGWAPDGRHRRHRRVPVSEFFPSHGRGGGGTWKWYAPVSSEAKRRHWIASNARPRYRAGYTRRRLAYMIATGRLTQVGPALA